MITFILLAAALAIGGAALISVPLLRKAPSQLAPARWAAMISGAVVVSGAALLYVTWSNWSWHPQGGADSPQTMVARLARRLEQNPADINGWMMLGRSYVVLEQFPLAIRAFERANRLAGGRNVEALLGEAEAMSRNDESELGRGAGRLIEQALVLEPNSGKALFFGAASALQRGELPLARDRFTRLLALNPPDNVRPLLERQVAAIDRQLAGLPPEVTPGGQSRAAGDGSSASPVGAAAAAASASQSPQTQTAGSPRLRINLSVSPSLASAAGGSAPLFVFVRDPARPGPPLAVKRLESHFPQSVELTASDSMMPGRTMVAGQDVQVIARIARSGNPVGASGDPFGQAAWRIGRDGVLNVVIDQTTP